MSITLRCATDRDVAGVLDFWSFAAENDSRPVDDAAAVTRLLERDPEALMLAAEDQQIVGTVVAGWDGWRCHIYRLAVHPDRRREGIGRHLLDWAEQRFAAAGASRVDAMVLDRNETGHAVWSRAGYTRQPDWSRWVKPITST